ncbi:MAG: hypothetical protein J1F28_00250 [Oscillospiraceae bacterium]|nr:hypothetical protein [Oscillospiraceae bacterium]
MKKFTAIILASIVALSMAGCSEEKSDDTNSSKNSSVTENSSSDTTGSDTGTSSDSTDSTGTTEGIRPVMKELLDGYDSWITENYLNVYSKMVDDFIAGGMTDYAAFEKEVNEFKTSINEQGIEWLTNSYPQEEEYAAMTAEEEAYYNQIQDALMDRLEEIEKKLEVG